MLKNILQAKRLLILLFAAAMLFGLLPLSAMAVSVVASGQLPNVGVNAGAQWTLYDDGTLVVYPGAIDWNNAMASPWASFSGDIQEIIFEFEEPVSVGPRLRSLFSGLSNVQTITGLEYFDTSGVISMESTFNATNALIYVSDISGWDVSSVTTMNSMFRYTDSLTSLDISNWETGSVTSTAHMFRGASGLSSLDLSDWDVSSVTNMNAMFLGASSLTSLDVSGWDTSNVTRMDFQFDGTSSLVSLDLSGWNVSSVTTMDGMFRNTSSLAHIGDVSGWETGSVTDLHRMFLGASSLVSLDLSGWDTSNVIRMDWTFRDANSLASLNLSGWDTSSVTNISNMFAGATALSQLTLGANWNVVTDNPNLPASPGPNYTGEWQNSPPSLVDPPGLIVYAPANLMSGSNGANNTWYWRKFVRTVTFLSGSNGTISPAPPATVSILSGDTLPAEDIPIPTGNALPAPGYKFAYWQSATGSTYEEADLLALTITANRTFTAIFAPSNALLVTFELNGGLYGGDPNSVYRYVLPGDPITVANVPIPTRADYHFLGWKEDDMDPLLNRIQVGDLIVTASRSFTAQWEEIILPPPGSGDSGSDSPWPGQPSPPRPPASNVPERQAYLIGTDEGIIRPNANITRAEVATIFFRLLTDEARAMYWTQENPFSDVDLQSWFNNAISTMTNADVFNGFPDGTFDPNQTITRAEMAAAIIRFTEPTADTDVRENHFVDLDGHWAADYINVAAARGWMHGYAGGMFRPDQAITRAEVAAMVNRVSGRLVERVEDLLPDMLTWPDNANENAWYYFYIQSATNSYTFQWRGANNAFERWVSIIPARDWTVLERPESRPDDILRTSK